MKEFPVLETKRLRLRIPVVKDIPHLMEYANNSKIAEMTFIPYPYRQKHAIEWINTAYKRALQNHPVILNLFQDLSLSAVTHVLDSETPNSLAR